MAKRKKGQPISGWLFLDKPLNISSTQALGKVRWMLNAQKGGHGGTLDPLATGVLPLAFGEATKLLNFVLDGHKSYRFTFTFGAQTATGDAEGEIVATSDVRPQAADIEAIIPQFLGEISQVPPAYSALKIDGERAYDLARKGEDVVLAARNVTIFDLKLLATDANSMTCEATVSKGTYIRTLAEDMGKALGAVGHLTMLRRTRVAKIDEKECITLETLAKHLEMGDIPAQLLKPLSRVLDDIPAIQLAADQVTALRFGRMPLAELPHTGLWQAKDTTGQLISLLQQDEGEMPSILRNFNNSNDIV